jgi:Domain of unknown function (DUF3597)
MAPQATPVSPMMTIDVVAKLEGLAAKHKERLNWKVSIVDLPLNSSDYTAAFLREKNWRLNSDAR